MAQLDVSYQQLISASNEFNNQAQKVRNLTQQMTSVVSNFGTIWRSDAQRAYTNKFNQLKADMDHMFRKLSEHSRDLKDIEQTYKKTEEQIKSQIQPLQTDFIH